MQINLFPSTITIISYGHQELIHLLLANKCVMRFRQFYVNLKDFDFVGWKPSYILQYILKSRQLSTAKPISAILHYVGIKC